MSISLFVAAGIGPVASARQVCESNVPPDDVCFTAHEDVAVAWAANSPWIQSHDENDVLVVLDGRLHNCPLPAARQAEFVLQRYRHQGVNFASGLLGDFIIVILDRNRRLIMVARDAVGVRPWYHATRARCHAGASDVAALTRLPWVDTSVNEHIAIEYLAAIEESRGESLYRGIGTLRPGWTWCRSDGFSKLFSHHRWEFEPELDISWEDAAERCRDVLDEAVRCRVNVSGPATSELSGGLDSSTVVGTVVRLGYPDLLVGRMLFDGKRADERSYSDAVIEHWGLAAISATPWIPDKEELTALTDALRRPCPDANFTMFVTLYRALLQEGRRDVLTGLGGDDAFVACSVASRVLSAVKLRRVAVLRELSIQAVRRPRESWYAMLRPTLGYLVAPWRKKGIPTWVSRAAGLRASLPDLAARRPEPVTGVKAIDERLAILTSGYMASTLETRALVSDWVGRRESHPFLDARFVKATYGLDPWWPTRGGHYRALEVDAFSDRLPAAVAHRLSKADFSEIFWPQVLTDSTLALVGNGPLRDLGWLDPDGFSTLVTNAKKGMANAAIPLFRCVSLDRWLRTQ